MGAVKKIQLPYSVLVQGNARMWYSIFKGMSRREFTEYPQRVRSFDDMAVAEYYAYKRVARARDDDKVWEQIQKTTEGVPAMQGTIQSDATQLHAYTQGLPEEDQRPGMTQAEIHGKIEPHKEEKKMKLQAKKTDKGYQVEWLGKTYEVKAGQKQIAINGVNFAIAGAEAEPAKAEEPKAEKKTSKKK
jgi:hypothetical protein